MIYGNCLQGLLDSIFKSFEKGLSYQIPTCDDAIKELLSAQLISKNKYSKVVFLVEHQKDLSKWFTHFQWIFREKPWTQDTVTVLPYISNYGTDRYVDHRNQRIQRQHSLLKLINSGQNQLILTTLTGLLQVTKPKDELLRGLMPLKIGSELDPDQVKANLLALGYRESYSVEVEGNFSMRGGIVDFFSPLYPHPIRVEIFLDEIKSIRFFDRADQRSIESLNEAILAPASEFYFSESQRQQLVQSLYSQALDRGVGNAERLELVESFKRGELSNTVAHYLPFLNGKTEPGLNYLPRESLWIFADGIHQTMMAHEGVMEDIRIALAKDKEKKVPSSDLEEHFAGQSMESFSDLVKGRSVDFTGIKPVADSQIGGGHQGGLWEIVNLKGQKDDPFEHWMESLKEYLSNQTSITILTQNTERQERIKSLLGARNLPIVTARENLPPNPAQESILLQLGFLSQAVYLEIENKILIPDYRLLGISPKANLSSKRKLSSTFQNFGDLNVKDLVVHHQHGVGRYLGLSKLAIGGQQTEFLILEYAGNDKIYLPVDRLNALSRYEISTDHSHQRALDRLGGSFEAKKQKVKLETLEIARQLLTEQAKRLVAKGYHYVEPDETFFSFEGDFPYEETDDQVKVLEEVEQDFRSGRPMDRLVCGDVGFGKTEIALRAAMRTVLEGYQVLILVPTTVLCYQHFSTFSKRMEKYGVRVDHANRFVPQKQVVKSLEDLSRGAVDILIGTHRLLSKDVKPAKLGLLVVDEEQRFGVLHKEKLKKLREKAHVLTLSATPIPRTLHMALLGLRDISVIATPPRQRLPIKTVIAPFDEEIISKAITQEIARGGQIFFVHNRVQDIDQFALKIARYCPDARIAVAHGKMGEHHLEQVIRDFLNHKYDLLLCTTIIEAGIDMPNVNTLIVDKADRFGLAQLYQIRGRVGRSNVQAYAYLLVESKGRLSEESLKKLDIIASHQELGAGFLIANRDLELRGAGELLGDSQSGHVQDLGLEIYRDLLLESISLLKGEPNQQRFDVEIKIPVDVFIPTEYIQNEKERLRIYKNLFACENHEELESVYEGLKDCYGIPPPEMIVIYRIASLKIDLRKMSVESLIFTKIGIELYFKDPDKAIAAGILKAIDSQPLVYRPLPKKGVLVKDGGFGSITNSLEIIDKIILLVAKLSVFWS